MQIPDPNTGKVRETVFVLTEKFPNDRRIMAVSRDRNVIEKEAFKAFGVLTAKHRREFYWVKSEETNRGKLFAPGEGWLSLYNQGTDTGVRIEWKWETV